MFIFSVHAEDGLNDLNEEEKRLLQRLEDVIDEVREKRKI